MARMFIEDAYSLGLLYSYIYAGKRMVLKDDLDNFYNIIELNLKSMGYDINNICTTIYRDNNPSIYFGSEGKEGEIYYALYSDFDLESAKSRYISCLSVDIFIASLKENALNALDLTIENGIIERKKQDKIRIPNCDFLKNAHKFKYEDIDGYEALQVAAYERIKKNREDIANNLSGVKDFVANTNDVSTSNLEIEKTNDQNKLIKKLTSK